MKRRILSILIALALCLSLLPGAAWAADEEIAETEDAIAETAETAEEMDKSGGWLELIPETMPAERTTFTAGGGTITWDPDNNTVTLNNATINAQNTGIVLTVPFTLVLEGNNTITTQTAGPITETGEHCGVMSRLDSLTITGPGSLTVNSAGRAIAAHTDLIVEGGANVTVQSQGTEFGLTALEGDLTIRENSSVHVSMVGSLGGHNGVSANNGTVTIENSHVFSKSQNGAAIIGCKVILKNSDVAAIGSVTDVSGVVHFLELGNSFLMDGGTLFVQNTGGNGYDFQYPSVDLPAITATNNAIIFYAGKRNYMIPKGDNIQLAGCVYDETTCTVTTDGTGYISGNFVWDTSIPVPLSYFVNVRRRVIDFEQMAWVNEPATLTIPAGMDAVIPALSISVPGSKLINNGTLTSTVGISNFGTIEGNGTLNASVQTREVRDGIDYDTFTAHGDATFHSGFTLIGLTQTTKNMIVIPEGNSLTIPAGATLDATANGTITAETLAEYYTNDGTLIVNGTAIFPADTDISKLGTITGTGTILIGSDTLYTVTVIGGTADKTVAKVGDTVTLTADPVTGKLFHGWMADDSNVTISVNKDGVYTFEMPSKSVIITAQYAYSVTFNSRGGGEVDSQTVVDGQTATAPAEPERANCTFLGWYTEAAGTTAFNFSTPITGNLTLYAKWDVPVEGVSVSPNTLTLTVGGAANLTAIFSPSDASEQSVTWESSNPAAATVDSSGKITAVGAGTAVITVTTAEGSKTAACTVTVNAKDVEPDFPSYPFYPSYPSYPGSSSNTSTPSAPNTPNTPNTPAEPLPDISEQPCDGGADCPTHAFTDLGPVESWYHEAVDYVLENGLMTGYSGSRFGPDDSLSRAQLAQILYNMEGNPAVSGGSVFADVADGQWYAPAVNWAVKNGVVSGYGDGRFGPDDPITREQLAVILWRYAGSPTPADTVLRFTDAAEASGYALEALCWAVENGILSGYAGGQLDPKGLATRAQVAQMLKNYSRRA